MKEYSYIYVCVVIKCGSDSGTGNKVLSPFSPPAYDGSDLTLLSGIYIALTHLVYFTVSTRPPHIPHFLPRSAFARSYTASSRSAIASTGLLQQLGFAMSIFHSLNAGLG
jgi:hypothetical protein